MKGGPVAMARGEPRCDGDDRKDHDAVDPDHPPAGCEQGKLRREAAEHVAMADGVEAGRRERQGFAGCDHGPAMSGEMLGGGPALRDPQPFERQVEQRDIALRHARQVKPGPAGASPNLEQAAVWRQLQASGRVLGLAPLGPARAAVVAAADSALDFAHDLGGAEAIEPARARDEPVSRACGP